MIDNLIKEENLPENKSLVRHGFIHGLLVEKDYRFNQIKNEICTKMDDEIFLDSIQRLIHASLSKTIICYDEKLKSQPENYIAKHHLEGANIEIDYLVNHTLIEYGDYIFKKYYNAQIYQGLNPEYIKENYIYYIIARELFEDRKQEMTKAIDHDTLVKVVYGESDIDLNQSDDQYSKYSLISINPNWLEHNTGDAYVYDPRIDKTFVTVQNP